MFKYKCIQLLIYPFIFIIAFIRFFLKKENFESIKQKLFCIYDYKKLSNKEIIIHFASIGELNSIKFLIQNLSYKNILLSCSTLSSFNLAKKKYSELDIIFLGLDFEWNVKNFLSKTNLKKIIWIDSEIWPNWLNISNKSKIKNILVNGRLSDKSYNKWKNFSSFSKNLGSKYDLVFAKSYEDKSKLETILQTKVNYFGNLKFYLDIKIHEKKEKNLCFASIHKSEFEMIIKIINRLNKNNFDNIYIIPRHIEYSNYLKSMININLSDKVKIHNEFGNTLSIFDKSKIVFMGGSLVPHGGQNPLEALSRGCYVITGHYTDNFRSQYIELSDKKLASILEGSLEQIVIKINQLSDISFNNSILIKNYFDENTKNFKNLVNMINEC